MSVLSPFFRLHTFSSFSHPSIISLKHFTYLSIFCFAPFSYFSRTVYKCVCFLFHSHFPKSSHTLLSPHIPLYQHPHISINALFLQSVYSRVARVCKNDRGGPHTFRNKWTTFLKTRLNCSVAGNYPFYFDEVQAMSNIVATRDGDMVFGIFNTPDNSIPGSAVCSFRMSDIQESFEGAFKGQNHVNANWLPLDDRELPEHRPGTCHNDSRSLNEEHLNFLKENMLMDRAVPSSIHLPHYIKTSPHERLTAIAVDPSVAAAGGETADLLFVGTTRGRVLKLASHRGRTHLVEELQVFPLHVAVNNLLVAREEGGKGSRLVVLSDHEVKSVPVARCHSANLRSCAECVALQVGFFSVPPHALF